MYDLKFILSFLKDLAKNNDREWFQDNKQRYQQAHAAFITLMGNLIDKIGKFDPDIATLDPKKCVFRIYRDVRFSKSKTPYKNNFGANMSPGGRKSGLASYYIHIQPGASMLAGGMYHPEPENLARIRQEIDYNPGILSEILRSSAFRNQFGEMKGEKLKRPPKGYDPEHLNIEWLKHKDFIVYKSISDRELMGKNFVDWASETFKVLRPFNDFFNVAVS